MFPKIFFFSVPLEIGHVPLFPQTPGIPSEIDEIDETSFLYLAGPSDMKHMNIFEKPAVLSLYYIGLSFIKRHPFYPSILSFSLINTRYKKLK